MAQLEIRMSRAASVIFVLAENVLHLYNWNNYISDETVARFEKQCMRAT